MSLQGYAAALRSCKRVLQKHGRSPIQFNRTKGIIEKCTLCQSRFEAGLQPLCAEVCTTRAIRFGARDDMLAYARQRVSMLQDQGYSEASVYGESEMGGTKVLLVLRDSPVKYSRIPRYRR